MAHFYIIENISSATPHVTTIRGWTASKATAQAYNVNFDDGDATVKLCTHRQEDPDLTGVPERDANDNIIE